MEQTSKLEQIAPTPPSERFIARASGTRRIIRPELDLAASEAATLPAPAPERHQRWLVRALNASSGLDARLRGRLLRSAGTVAAASGAALPLLASGGAAPGSLRAAGWLSFSALSVAGWLWAARCRTKLGSWSFASVRQQLADSLRSSQRDLLVLARAPKNLRLSLLSRLTRVAGFAVLGLSIALACLELSLGRVAPTVSGACLWGALALFASRLLSLALRLQTQPVRVDAAELALAQREFSPIVDLSTPQELESVFFDPTPLHQVMAALSSWRDGARWRTPHGCALAFQRHFASRLPAARLELGRWLGTSGRADLIVDDCVLVDFQIGLERAEVPLLIERLRSYRHPWGARPIVVVMLPRAASVDRDALEALQAPGSAPRWIVAVAQ